MISLGSRIGSDQTVLGSDKTEEYFPSLYMEGDAGIKLGLDKVELGAEVELRIKCRVTSMSKSRHGSSISLEVLAADKPAGDDDPASKLFPGG